MGTAVLRAASSDPTLRAYAHCSAGEGGAGATTVRLLVLGYPPEHERIP